MKFIKSLIITTLMFAVSTTFASNKPPVFDITSNISVNGKHVSSPRVIVIANKLGSVKTSDGLQMDVTAKDDVKNKTIQLSYDIHYVNGNDVIHVTPKLIVKPKQTASIKMTTDTKNTIELQVVAKKVRG